MTLSVPLPNARFVLVAVALMAMLVVVWAMVDRRGPANDAPQPSPTLKTAREEADSLLKNFVYTFTDKLGAPQWRLAAKKATHYRDENLIELDGLKITFFADERPTYTVTAAKGVVNTQNQDFGVSGNVTGKSDDGVRFRTESLTYRADIQEARTEERVFLESPQFNLEGRGMIMDVKNQKVSLLGDVKATVKE